MAENLGEAVLELSTDGGRFNRELNRAEGRAQKFHKALKVGALAAGGALVGLGIAAKIGWDEYAKGARAAAQTNAVLKSTGGVANVTAKGVGKLATSLMNLSGIDDEAAQAGENMLLTFRNIRNESGKGNDIFDQTTKTLTDMAFALNNGAAPSAEEMSKQAIRLGKALNDPIKGITALSRVGVQFTQGQKDQIAALVESGHTLKAQKIILKELNAEFGGSAKAAGQTVPGKINILKESLKNLAGQIVGDAMPSVMRFVNWITVHMPQIERVARAIAKGIGFAFNDIIVPAVQLVARFVRWLAGEWRAHGEQVKKVLNVISNVVVTTFNFLRMCWQRWGGDVIAILKTWWAGVKLEFEIAVGYVRFWIATFKFIWKKWGKDIKELTRACFEAVKGTMKTVLDGIRNAARLFGDLFHGRWKKLWGDVKRLFSQAWDDMKSLLSRTIPAFSDIATRIGRAIIKGSVNFVKNHAGDVRSAVAAIPGKLLTLAGKFASVGAQLGSALVSALKSAINWFIGKWNGLSFKTPGFKILGQSVGSHTIGVPPVGKLATGGQALAGHSYLVGERGPEIMTPRASGVVTPNSRLGGTTINVNIEGSLLRERELWNIVRKQGTQAGRRVGVDNLFATS